MYYSNDWPLSKDSKRIGLDGMPAEALHGRSQPHSSRLVQYPSLCTYALLFLVRLTWARPGISRRMLGSNLTQGRLRWRPMVKICNAFWSSLLLSGGNYLGPWTPCGVFSGIVRSRYSSSSWRSSALDTFLSLHSPLSWYVSSRWKIIRQCWQRWQRASRLWL